MDDDSLTTEDIRGRIAATMTRHDVKRCILFGSRARNEQTRRSDIDLLLVKETDERFLDRMRDLQGELGRLFPEAPVEALCYTEEELRRMRHRKFIESILAEGKVVYERS